MTGILVLDKPEGFTSFDAVAKVRGICREKKCGHSGTLDPMATGVMTILLGAATRFCELLPDHDKAYEATLKLGITTDTLDRTGRVISQCVVNAGKDDFLRAAEEFKGEITQIPPMYSAVSVNGQRLYKLARQGIEVERPSRQVNIDKLELLSCDEEAGEYKVFVGCSSGTYIRTLVSDIGEKLGTGAVLTSLRRVKANGFGIERAVTFEAVEKAVESRCADSLLIPVDEAVAAYPEITVSEGQAKRFSNGGSLLLERLTDCSSTSLYRVYSPDRRFLGLGENDGTDSLKVKRVYTG